MRSSRFGTGSRLSPTALTRTPRRREVWLVELGAGRSGEPGKTRPAVVVSANELINGVSDELIVVVPLSSSLAPSALRIVVTPDAGVERPSRAVCRAVRAIVRSRFVRRLGEVDEATMDQVDMALTMILELDRKPVVE